MLAWVRPDQVQSIPCLIRRSRNRPMSSLSCRILDFHKCVHLVGTSFSGSRHYSRCRLIWTPVLVHRMVGEEGWLLEQPVGACSAECDVVAATFCNNRSRLSGSTL